LTIGIFRKVIYHVLNHIHCAVTLARGGTFMEYIDALFIE